MTTRAQLISKISKILNDTPTTSSFTGRGEEGKTLFNFKSKPVVPDSETILVNGAVVTNYAVDYENGVITFVSAPSDGATITGSYEHSYYSHQAKIDALNDVLSSGFLRQEIYDDDAITTVAGTYAYDLPANVYGELLEVWLYDSNENKEKRLRLYTIEKGAGTDGVDRIVFQNEQDAGLLIGLGYVKVFSSLDDDSDETDLPIEGELAACLKAAADVLLAQEPPRLLSGKKLGYKADTDGAREMSHVALSEKLEQKAIRERTRAGLSPSFTSTIPIIND